MCGLDEAERESERESERERERERASLKFYFFGKRRTLKRTTWGVGVCRNFQVFKI